MSDKIKESLAKPKGKKNPRYPAKTGTTSKSNWKNPNGRKKQK